MLGLTTALIWAITAVGVVLLLAALVGRAPKNAAFALVGLAELLVVAAIIVDVTMMRGHDVPDMVTHVSYLITAPLMVPAAIALTYKKIDRWGLLILAAGALLAAIMVVRVVQTLGIDYARIGG